MSGEPTNGQLQARLTIAIDALEIIAGKRQCLDNLMGNQDVALEALSSMAHQTIIDAADRLGIKPTHAPVGSQVWEAWADRVEQAAVQECEAEFFRNEGRHAMAVQVDLQMEATIAEANRYAI